MEYNDKPFKQSEVFASELVSIYEKAIDEAVRIGLGAGYPTSGAFKFSSLPLASKQWEKLLMKTTVNAELHFSRSIYVSWYNGLRSQDKLIKSLINSSALSEDYLKEIAVENLPAFKSLQERKGDIKLSDRVWQISRQFESELQYALDLEMSRGGSAGDISRRVRNLLREPDRLFRRVRDKHGNLVLSDASKAYKTGRGVYRSSYKNAMRLARTENNIAYHSATMERYQSLDFIVGYKVILSNNPNHCPFCESMTGDYLKTFKFTGWHPQCRCTTIPILKTNEEMELGNEAIANGKKPPIKSKNKVYKVPKNLQDWVDNNKAKLSDNPPYFYRDNKNLFEKKPKRKVARKKKINY